MSEKLYLDAQTLLEDSFKLAADIYQTQASCGRSFEGIDKRSRQVAVYGLSYLIKNLTFEDRLLIVDDVFDTGHTVAAIIDAISSKLRRNTPQDIRVAVPYYKPARNQTELLPDYYLHETDRWLKYPHSLEGLSIEEIKTHHPDIYAIIGKHLDQARIEGNQ